jgi:hypothetical protein
VVAFATNPSYLLWSYLRSSSDRRSGLGPSGMLKRRLISRPSAQLPENLLVARREARCHRFQRPGGFHLVPEPFDRAPGALWSERMGAKWFSSTIAWSWTREQVNLPRSYGLMHPPTSLLSYSIRPTLFCLRLGRPARPDLGSPDGVTSAAPCRSPRSRSAHSGTTWSALEGCDRATVEPDDCKPHKLLRSALGGDSCDGSRT